MDLFTIQYNFYLNMRRDRLGWSVQPKTPVFISLVITATVILALVTAISIRLYSRSGKEDRETIPCRPALSAFETRNTQDRPSR